MKKALIVILVSVLLIIMAGPIGFCGKPNDPDPRFANCAMNVINSMKAGDYQNAVKDFNAPLRSKATPESLSKEWSKMTNMLGPLKDCVITHGEPETGPDSIYGVYFTCRFKRGISLDGVIKFDADGKITDFQMRNSRRFPACLLMSIAFVLIGAVTVGLCRLLKLNPVRPKIENPKRSAVCALLAVSASMFVLTILTMHSASPKSVTTTGMDPTLRLLLYLAPQLILILVYCLPMALMLRLNRETLRSAGLTASNFWKVTIIGLFLAALTLIASGKGGTHSSYEHNHPVAALVYCSLVGFGEEFLFRGYLQTRLVAWLGHYQGWILTSVAMALGHVPARVFIQGSDFPHALTSSLGLIPVSLLMGFIMLRTGSIIPSGIFHTFLGWVNTR